MLPDLKSFENMEIFINELKLFFDDEKALFKKELSNTKIARAFFYDGKLILNIKDYENNIQASLIRMAFEKKHKYDADEYFYSYVDFTSADVKTIVFSQNEARINIKSSDNEIVIRDKKFDFLRPEQVKLKEFYKFMEFESLLDKKNLDFVEDIDVNNKQTFYKLLNNNKDKLDILINYYIEAKNLKIDFFNITKENKELLQLKTDIDYSIFNLNNGIWNHIKKVVGV